MPSASTLFELADTALTTATELRRVLGDAVLLAQSTAAQAEMFYCMASAMSEGARIADGQVLHPISRSLQLNQEALRILSVREEGEKRKQKSLPRYY